LNTRLNLHFNFFFWLLICSLSLSAQKTNSSPYTVNGEEFFENLSGGWLPDSTNLGIDTISSNFYFKNRKDIIDNENILWKSLVIKNDGNESLNGELKVFSAGFLKPLGPNYLSINLSSNSDTTIIIPFIVDKNNADGGKTTSIQAVFTPLNSFVNSENRLQTVSFVKLKKSGDWLIRAKLENPTWLSFEMEKYVKLEISNKSNSSKRFKINLKRTGISDFRYEKYIELAKFKDTVIEISISRPSEDLMEENRYLIEVNNDNQVKQCRIYTNFYENSFESRNDYTTTPLNVSLGAFNFGGRGSLGFSFKTWGDINFSEDQKLSYSVLLFNLNKEIETGDIWRFSRGNISYSDGNSSIKLGDESLGGDFYREFGRGMQVNSDLFTGKDFSLGVGYVKNLFIDRASYNSSGDFNFQNIHFRPNFIYSVDKTNLVNKVEGSISGSTNIKNHNLSVGLSQSVRTNLYDSTNFQSGANTYLADTTLPGFGISFGYSVRVNRWRFSARSMSKSKYHAGAQGGVQNQHVSVSRKIGEKNSALLSFDRRENTPSESFRGRLVNFNFSDLSRTYLNYNYRIFNTLFTTGIHYHYSELTNEFDPVTAAPRKINFYASPRLITRASGKIDNIKLSAFVQTGPTYFVTQMADQGMIEGTLTQIGVHVGDEHSTFSVRFSDGIFSPSIVGLNAISLNNSSNFYSGYRFNKKMLHDKMSVNLSATYTNYVDAKVSMLNCFINSELSLNQGIVLSAFFTLSSYANASQERVSKSIFTNAGFTIRKAFDFDQPVLSYRDIVVSVYFDQNGNSRRDSNENVISDVLVKIDGDKNNLQRASSSLLTNTDGTTFFQNVPAGNYKITIDPIGNMNAGIGGTDFFFTLKDNSEIGVPLTEKYVLDGRVFLKKAKYSRVNNFDYSLLKIKVIDPRNEITIVNVEGDGSFRRQLTKVEGLYQVELLTKQIPSFLIPEQSTYYFDIDGFKSYQINFKINEAKPAMFIIDK